MTEAIVFDCFGVLITDALETMVAKVRDDQPEVAKQIVDIVRATAWGHISRQDSSETIAALLGIPMNEYFNRLKQGEIKNEELLRYITELRGRYKTALLSNISIGGLAVRFTAEELAQHFDVVVASGELGCAKPDAQIYQITAERLGIPLSKCVFIDDRVDYCEGSRAAGMPAIVYTSNGQLLGELEATYGVALTNIPEN